MPNNSKTPPARRRLLCAAILGALAGCSRPQRPDTLRAAPGSICLSEDAVPVAYPFALATILRTGKSRRQPAAFAMHEPRRGYGYAEATGTDTPVFWDVTFRFDTCDARRFMMWFVEELERGVLEFTLPIRTEFGNLDHTCRFLPDGLLDCTEDGGLWTYRATIMARAQVIPADAVTAYTAAFAGPIPAQTLYVGAPFTLALGGYFSGGLGPYTYSVHSGTLSPGLTLDSSTGIVSGTPTSLLGFGDVVFMREGAYCSKVWTDPVSFSATPADSSFADVALLLKFEGANGSTTITDSSTNADHKTASTGMAISTAAPLFGTSSLRCVHRGPVPLQWTGSRFGRASGAAATYEGWTKRTSTTAATETPPIFILRDGAANELFHLSQYSTGNQYTFRVGASGSFTQYAYTPDGAGKVHWAVTVKTDNTWQLWIQGELAASGSGFASSSGVGCNCLVGGSGSTDTGAITYDIDNIRVTNGSAPRYTSAFTPPGDFPAG